MPPTDPSTEPSDTSASVPVTTPSPLHPPPPQPDEPYVLSYFALRRAAGWIGIALPVVVCGINEALHHCIPDSISGAYYTDARNYFVGSLCSVGVFLFCAVGYARDTKFSIFAGLMAFLVAFNPCTPPTVCGTPTPLPYPQSPHVHGAAAVLLFLTFAYFCLVLFTRTTDDPNGFAPRLKDLPRRKRQRNIVFIICGSVMLVAMLTIPITSLLHIKVPYITLIVEWICLWAFGLAWLVKGQQLLGDV